MGCVMCREETLSVALLGMATGSGKLGSEDWDFRVGIVRVVSGIVCSGC
jgi:hypothetical protein